MKRIANRYRTKGFTITELVAVTSIAAAVVAMTLPAMNVARQQERTVVGLARLQQMGQAVYIFTVDNSNHLPYGYYRDAGSSEAPGPGETDWTIMLNDFLGGGGATYDELATGPRNNELLPMFTDPNATIPDEGLYHYSAHPVLMPDKNEWDSSYELARFRRPHEVFLIADAIQRPNGRIAYTSFATLFAMDNYSLALTQKPYFDAGDQDNNDVIAPGFNRDPIAPVRLPLANIRWRQKDNTAANFVFSDGHCETRRMNEITKRNIRVDR